MTRLTTLALVILTTGTIVRTQTPAPRSFELASVKVNRTGQPFGMGPTLQPGGRVRAINVLLIDLIRAAYGVEENQIVSAPPVPDVFYDIEARTSPTATVADAAGMLRTLLADRFGFKAHRETRPLPVYTLLRVSRTTLGPALKPSGNECAPLTFPAAGRNAPPPPPPPPPSMEGSPIAANRRFSRCPTVFFPGGISARAVDMEGFAGALALFVHRPVIDRTELRGDFDIDLSYAPDYALGPDAAPSTSSAPSLVTALREQLGLRLESTRAPVEVLVVDQIRPPTEN